MMRMKYGMVMMVVVALVLGGCASPPRGTVGDPYPASADRDRARSPSNRPPASAHGAVSWAKARVGTPYRWGGTGAKGFDCSGLVQAAFHQVGVNLPRTTRAQAHRGQIVPRDEILPGDLIFFGRGKGSIDHVGIATGRDRFVHASSSRGVVEDSLRKNRYFRDRYVFARRLTTTARGR